MMDLSLTDDTRAERLTGTAALLPDLPAHLIDLALREWAHPALTVEEGRAAMEELHDRLRQRDGLASGVLDWHSIAPELNCRDRFDAAEQIACERVDDALRPLMYGPPTIARRNAA